MENNRIIDKKFTRRGFLGGTAISGTAFSLASTLGTSLPAYASTTGSTDDSEESLPSGRQFEIRRGDTQAVVTEVGAGLRVFSVQGQEFLFTYGRNEMSMFSEGQVLIPFPNRIDHGMYMFNGVTEQLPLNEPARQNAIHGLTRWMNWQLVEQEEDRATLSLVLHAQDGYPFVLALRETYELTEHRLAVKTVARNIGATALPYGVGHHPYLTVGTHLINPDILRLPAQSYFLTNDRLIPLPPAVSVAGTPFDFRTPHAIGDVRMDTGLTDLIFDKDGFARVKLAAPGGKPEVTVFMDSNHRFLQVFTGDALPASTARRSIAIEPYTCAANAFNNGLGLRVLQPGKSFQSVWGITVSL
jgi:aldose 1-epimerase